MNSRVPKTDIYETEKNVIIQSDIPGVGEDDVDISVENNILTIKASVMKEQDADYKLTVNEFDTDIFERSLSLSNEIDTENVDATLKNGVLKLSLMKKVSPKVKKINVQSA